jgi:serine/threonine-protein kinase
VVYRARQLALNREVALKMLLAGAYAGEHDLARFRREAETLAQMQHPGIVQIYELGEAAGHPYLALEYVEGGTLAARIAHGPPPPEEVARWVATVARAVAAAHAKGIIHRDLKPGNVLLTADGTPKVSDFGLAKQVAVEAAHTPTGAVLGTPAYMAPEQASGKAGAVSFGADVYALGVILYEALTGRPPFRGKDYLDTLHLVVSAEPVRPSRVRPGVPRALERVCLKCLEKRPERRYRSAAALANDLEHWLRKEPVRLGEEGRLRRLWWWVERQRRKLAGAAVLLLALAGGFLLLQLAPPNAGQGFTPTKPEGDDPERALRAIERELAQGKAVTLIGATGGPRWFRVRWGGVETLASVAEGGTFSVHSWADLTLVELVPNVPCERYRLRAQIMHQESLERGGAGLYFGRTAYPGPYSDLDLFAYLHFNEVRANRELWAKIPFPRKPPPPKGNHVRLDVQLYGIGKAAGTSMGFWEAGSAGAVFQPKGIRARRWHDFEVVVTPEGLSARRDGLSAGELTTSRVTRLIGDGLQKLRASCPDDARVRGIPATFRPQGGAGLYLLSGSAHFRSVEITPLPGPH